MPQLRAGRRCRLVENGRSRTLTSLTNHGAFVQSLRNRCSRPGEREGREQYLTTPELAQIGEAVREAETIELPYTVDETKPKAKGGNRRTVIGPRRRP